MQTLYKPGISIIIASWNEYKTVRTSVERLIEEGSLPGYPCALDIIVSDNGSTDLTRGWLAELGTLTRSLNVTITHCNSYENRGSSVQRNRGLLNARYPYVFFLDGDIEYVPDTLLEYVNLLESLRQVDKTIVAVGHNNPEIVRTTGINGVRDPNDPRIDTTAYRPEGTEIIATIGYPMAWVQYGLFWIPNKTEWLFPTEPPFNEAGHGYEDDWYYSMIEQKGLNVAFVDYPIYYHDANKGLRNLKEDGVPTRFEERRETYFKRWGHYGFVHRLQTGAYSLTNYRLKR